jgi:hypothetical protein
MPERRDFFDRMYACCDGGLELRVIKERRVNQHFFELVDHESIGECLGYYPGWNIYFGVGTRDASGRGAKANVLNVPALWTDIDFKNIKPEETRKRAADFPFRPTACVGTGHGVHLYWLLREPAEPAEFGRIEDLLRRVRQHFDGDPAACEVARVLRVPGSVNVKSEPVPVVLHYLRDFSYNLEDFEDLPEVDTPATTADYTPRDLPSWVYKCDFIRWCKDHSEKVTEPLWYAALSNLLTIRPGGKALCHEFSKNHPNYTARETDLKILHALDYGPHTCAFIHDKGFECSKACGVKSPAALGFTRRQDSTGEPSDEIKTNSIEIQFR